MKPNWTAVLAGISLIAVPCFAAEGPDLSQLPPPSDKTGLTFTNDIEPILKASCLGCHSAQRPRGGLRLDTLDGALKGGMHNGQTVEVITPGKSETSPLVIAVARLDPHTAMPPMRRNRPGPPPGAPGAPGGPDGATNAPANPPPPPANPPPDGNPPATPPPGGPPGPNGRFGPPPKPLTPEQVGVIRAWIDQGAK